MAPSLWSLGVGTAVSLVGFVAFCLAWAPRRPPVPLDAELLTRHSHMVLVRGKRLRVVFIPHKLRTQVPLLVFIHGSGGQVSQWTSQIQHFSQTANVLAIDLLGHGASEKPYGWREYRLAALVEDLASLTLQFAERVGNPAPEDSTLPTPSSSQPASPRLSRENTLSALPRLGPTLARTPSFPFVNSCAADDSDGALPPIVLVAHSYGTSLAVHLHAHIAAHVKGIVLICPTTASNPRLKALHSILSTPTPVLNLFRLWDRRGGLYSHSVNRYVYEDASEAIRAKQLAWNAFNETYVVKRVVAGMAFPAESDFRALRQARVPVLLMGGEGDKVTPKEEMALIHRWLTLPPPLPRPRANDPSTTTAPAAYPGAVSIQASEPVSLPIPATPTPKSRINPRQDSATPLDSPSTLSAADTDAAHLEPPPSLLTSPTLSIAKTGPLPVPSPAPTPAPPLTIRPAPRPVSADLASSPIDTVPRNPRTHKSIYPSPYVVPKSGHSLCVESPELVIGIMTKFFIERCGLESVSLQRQIRMETSQSSANKWSLKNHEKWKRTQAISPRLALAPFRAMKVLRSTDATHSPETLLAAVPSIGLIVDLSKENPPYDTSVFGDFDIDFDVDGEGAAEDGAPARAAGPAHGVLYKKLGTTSKIPPTREEVARFAHVCRAYWARCPDREIAVHCHYGFNRTGFALAAFLIQDRGVPIADAIQCFADARPQGIRHDYFKTELYLRYASLTRLRAPKSS